MNPVIHFEIGGRDKEKMAAFYETVFGWKLNAEGLIPPATQQGISGHLTALGHEPNNYVTVYVEVDDIEKMIETFEANGGKKFVGPVQLPTGQYFAWVTDPDTNIIGLITRE